MVVRFLLLLLSYFIAVQADNHELGKGYYLPNENLLGRMFGGPSILNNLPSECIQTIPNQQTYGKTIYTMSTQQFYSYVQASTDLSIGLKNEFTLGLTLSTAYAQTSYEEYSVKGLSLDFAALTKTRIIDQNCYGKVTLNSGFLRDLNQLPLTVSNPHNEGSWYAYQSFLNRYGSHVTTQIDYGSRVQQWTLAESSSSYSTTDFQIRACADFEGMASFGQVTSSSCAGYSTGQKQTSMSYNMQNSIFARGGTAQTRAKIVLGRTKELVEQFLLEANQTDNPINYQYKAVWDIIRYKFTDKDSQRRATNLKNFYYGFLQYDCSLRKDGNNELRKFELSDDGIYTSPVFSCKQPYPGCQSRAACHLSGGFACHCWGDGCIDRNDNGEATIRHTKQGGPMQGINHSCQFKPVRICTCDESGNKWETLWTSSNIKDGLVEIQVSNATVNAKIY